jgi:hypothetical protein
MTPFPNTRLLGRCVAWRSLPAPGRLAVLVSHVASLINWPGQLRLARPLFRALTRADRGVLIRRGANPVGPRQCVVPYVHALDGVSSLTWPGSVRPGPAVFLGDAP